MNFENFQKLLYRTLLIIILESPNITVTRLIDEAMTRLSEEKALDLTDENYRILLISSLTQMYETKRNWISCHIDFIPVINESDFNSLIWSANKDAHLAITQSGEKY